MSFDNSYTAVTGATYAASDYNTYVKGNLTAIWVGTTAGDIDYYTSATAKSRLAIGAQWKLLKSTGSAPAWDDLVNIAAAVGVVASQATGDLIKAASATALGRVAIGAAGTFVKSDGSAPGYGALMHRRKGGSATVWATTGTTDYTPAKELVQAGVTTVSIVGGTGTVAVAFPVAYSNSPIVLLTPRLLSPSARVSAPTIYALSATGFTVEIFYIDGGTFTIDIHWLAIGE